MTRSMSYSRYFRTARVPLRGPGPPAGVAGRLHLLRANRVGQEYFSAPAWTFFLSLVLLGVCLRRLPGDPQAPPVTREERAVATGIVLVCSRSSPSATS
jgi:hypothetical protein